MKNDLIHAAFLAHLSQSKRILINSSYLYLVDFKAKITEKTLSVIEIACQGSQVWGLERKNTFAREFSLLCGRSVGCGRF